MPHIKLDRAVLCINCDTVGNDLNQCCCCLSTAVYPLARFLSRENFDTGVLRRPFGLPMAEVVERVMGALNGSVAQSRPILKGD